MMDSCIQPEVILVEGSDPDETSLICTVDESLTSHLPVCVEIQHTDSGSIITETIPLPHLLNEGGSWQEGNLIGVEIGDDNENGVGDVDGDGQEIGELDEGQGTVVCYGQGESEDQDPGTGEGEGIEESEESVIFVTENVGDKMEMDLGESQEIQQPQRPTLRPRIAILKKRGRKGMPRKAALTAAKISHQNQSQTVSNVETTNSEKVGNDNPNLFQVALKMTMRSSEERKPRPAYMVPVPIVVKRASLSLQDKVNIIQELGAGEKQSTICKKLGLPKSTVQSIWKNREKIQGSIDKIGLDRKRCRRAQHEDIEDKLIEWINTLKAQSVPVNGPQLRAKAQVMAKQMGLTEFRCSTGWLDKFKTRHGIIFKKSKSSPRSMDAGDRKAALDWVTKVWPALADGYIPQDIFNVDEAGIFYRSPPDKAHRLKGETCADGKMNKERITALLCTNSDGSEKLKLNVCGCLQNPRSFAGISNFDNLPAVWHYNPYSWITSDIFVSWLANWDELLRSTERQIILILDNSPAHSISEQFTNIKLVFLPPIVASILQPMQQGIVSRFKLHYRRLLLDRMVRKAELRASRTITILEALTMLSTAWTEVCPESITECFRTSNLQSLLLPDMGNFLGCNGNGNDYEGFLENEPKLLQQAIRVGIPIPDNVSFKEYAQIDSSLHVTEYDSVSPREEIGSGEGELIDEEFVQPVALPVQREVQDYIDAIRNWAMMSTGSCDTSVHTALSILESFALRARPPNVEMKFGLRTGSDQEIPVSVIVSSQNGDNNDGNVNGGSNVTLTTFDVSQQQMVQIPISIHSQSTELVTLTALDSAPSEDMEVLDLEDDGSPNTDSTHPREAHVQVQQAMHFQHDQGQPQFFAYLG